MDALVLPLLSEGDSPEAAIHQMRLSKTHAVVLQGVSGYRVMTNDQVLGTWVEGRKNLEEQLEGFPAAHLISMAAPIWRAVGSAEEVFSPAARERDFAAELDPLQPQVWSLLDSVPTDYGVLPALGGAVLVVTRREIFTEELRTRRVVCRCQHLPMTIPENPPAVQDGAPCSHGGGTYRCC